MFKELDINIKGNNNKNFKGIILLYSFILILNF
jgi:hypothetical protein